MHIPDGFLSPGVAVTAWAVAAAGVAFVERFDHFLDRVDVLRLGQILAAEHVFD